jgi:hypothetical protein
MLAMYIYKMLIKNPKKKPQKYICDICVFECRNKKDYTRHLSTAKHKRLIMANERLMKKTPHANSSHIHTTDISSLPKVSNTFGVNIQQQFECHVCNKVYSHLSSLCKHKKKCCNNEVMSNEIEPTTQLITLSKEKESEFKDLVLLLLKENKEIQRNFIDIIPYIKGNITCNSHNTTTNNNQFNINMFLNEQCKNAMNLTDFIHSLPITNETYDNTIENGLTQTITSLITNGLNSMNVLERPIHCTDPNRKTMYVKDNNVWERDNELNLLLDGIKTLSLKQRTLIDKWQDANAGWEENENLQTKLTTLVFNSMTSIEDDSKETNKIIRAIGKSTYLSNDIKMSMYNLG